MLNKVLYYIIVFPLSKLPLWLLYIIFKPFYLIAFYLIGYRKAVVRANVKNSFPQLSEQEQNKIVKDFYIYFSHLMAESIKNLSISDKELKRRVTVSNPEIMTDLYQDNKNVILLSSHFNNWELLITAQNLIFEHKAVGIGMPLSNSFWDKKLNARRERFGMLVVNAKNYKASLAEMTDINTATLVLGDQSPSNIENVYWTEFLNQTTPFYFGAEIMANQMDAAVVYAEIQSEKQGYYQIKLKLITDQPRNEAYGHIIQTYISALEEGIKKTPSRWLWSHKRWKIDVPENVDDLKSQHQLRFESKFR